MPKKASLEKLRDNLELELGELREEWKRWGKLQEESRTSSDVNTNTESIMELTKYMFSVIEKSRATLSCYSKYVAELELKLEIFPKDTPKKKVQKRFPNKSQIQ